MPPVPSLAETRAALEAARRIPIRPLSSLAVCVAAALLIVGPLALAPHARPALLIALAAPLAVGMLQLAVLVHACAHDALFGRPLDRLLGPLLGLPALVPFGAYRQGHLAHHRFTGTARDPAPAPGTVAPSRLLTGLMRLRLLPVFYWAGVYGRYLLYAVLPTADERRGRDIARWGLELGGGLALWALLVADAPARGVVLALGWLGGGVLYEHIFTFTQHLGLRPATAGVHGPRSQTHFARSVRLPGAALVLHFNLHKEHHLAPGLHWQRLPALHAALRAARPDVYHFTDDRIRPWSRRAAPAHRVLSARVGDRRDP